MTNTGTQGEAVELWQFEFVDPFSGSPIWRESASEWNGQRPRASRPLYAVPPSVQGVPREPTSAMIYAGRRMAFGPGSDSTPSVSEIWEAMYDAALHPATSTAALTPPVGEIWLDGVRSAEEKIWPDMDAHYASGWHDALLAVRGYVAEVQCNAADATRRNSVEATPTGDRAMSVPCVWFYARGTPQRSVEPAIPTGAAATAQGATSIYTRNPAPNAAAPLAPSPSVTLTIGCTPPPKGAA